MTSDGEWLKSMDGGWAEAREAAIDAELDPSYGGETGGSAQVLFTKNDGDWARLGMNPETLVDVVQQHRHLARTTEPEIRLLRALSIIGGWAIDSIWPLLLDRLREAHQWALAYDTAQMEKGAESRRAFRVMRNGICALELWLSALNSWWETLGRSGSWAVQTAPELTLSWDSLPDEALVGPALVQWVMPGTAGNRSELPRVSALLNGVLHDVDDAAYYASMYFFIICKEDA